MSEKIEVSREAIVELDTDTIDQTYHTVTIPVIAIERTTSDAEQAYGFIASSDGQSTYEFAAGDYPTRIKLCVANGMALNPPFDYEYASGVLTLKERVYAKIKQGDEIYGIRA